MKDNFNFSRKEILNAFKPNIETDDPLIFAGRENEVLQLVDSLQMDGSCPIIFGSRGTGKSSLALQMMSIASGEKELLEILGYHNRILKEEERYKVFYISCSALTQTIYDILNKIIIEAYRSERNQKVESGGQSTMKLGYKIIEFEKKKDYILTSKKNSVDQDIEDKFLSFAYEEGEKKGRKLLFIVDELDRMKDTTGVAEFLKTKTGPYIKFLLVGIGNNVSSLIADHRSILMKLDAVKLEAMQDYELYSIMEKVESRLKEKKINVDFHEETKKYIVKLSGGFPWYAHVLGQQSLIAAHNRSDLNIYFADVEIAKRKVLEHKLTHEFKELYCKVACNSRNREIILRLFARYNGEIIPLSVINKLAKDLEINNPYLYKKQLMDQRFEKVLSTPGIHKSQTVVFSNQLFKQYVNLCDSFNPDVKKEVESKWASVFQMETI